MRTRNAMVVLFIICLTQVAVTGDPDPEVLPVPPAEVIDGASIVVDPVITVPYSYDSVAGRRLSARLEVASSIVRGHLRARVGRGHPATWLADSVRRKADQLQDGFQDGAPPELLARNMFQIHDDVNELMREVYACQLQHVHRHMPEKLQEIEKHRYELAALLGVPNQ